MKDVYVINWGEGDQWQVSRNGYEYFRKLDAMMRNLWNSVMVSDKESALYWADKEEEDGCFG